MSIAEGRGYYWDLCDSDVIHCCFNYIKYQLHKKQAYGRHSSIFFLHESDGSILTKKKEKSKQTKLPFLAQGLTVFWVYWTCTQGNLNLVKSSHNLTSKETCPTLCTDWGHYHPTTNTCPPSISVIAIGETKLMHTNPHYYRTYTLYKVTFAYTHILTCMHTWDCLLAHTDTHKHTPVYKKTRQVKQ